MSINDTKDTNPSSTNLTPAQILEKARDWGISHGWALATVPEIRAAVLADEEIDWLDDVEDLLWDGLDFDDEDLEKLDADLREAVEEAAREAAQEAGEKLIATLTPDQVDDD